MSDGKSIYGGVRAGAIRVAKLPDEALRALLSHLGRKQKLGATAGRIGSEAMAEAVIRFMGEAEMPEAGEQKQEASEGTEALTDFVNTQTDAPDA